jgi:type VII secretion protein EccB
MQSRRDQVQAYRFVTRRIVSALISGEPETTDLPMRRLAGAMFAGVMVAAIVFAGAGVYGLLTRSSGELEANTLVIERETHARYVFVNDRLHPVLNYASARLIVGQAEPVERAMSQRALRDEPRGPMLGIPGAPDGLPQPDALVNLPWRLCSRPPDVDVARPVTTAVIGRDLTGGTPLGPRALFVASGEEEYLLWNDRRLRIGGETPRVVLGLALAERIPGTPQLINSITAGPDLAGIQVPGAGATSSFVLDGEPATIGRIFRVGTQSYLMTRDGLVPVGEVTAEIRIQGGLPARDIDTQDLNTALTETGLRVEPEGFPQAVPELYPVPEAAPTICAVYRGDGTGALATSIEVFDTAPELLRPSAVAAVPATQTDRDEVATVDRVVVASGTGALVRAVPVAGATADGVTINLITADGIRYPLTAEAVTALGYEAVEPVPVPAAMVAMIPLGPTLAPDAAGQVVAPAAG